MPTRDEIMKRPISVLFSSAEIADRVNSLAREIAARMSEDLLLAAVLKGSFVFAADLVRALHHTGLHPQIDFITLSSYGAGKESSGTVELKQDLSDSIKGREILLVDDILESGRTVAFGKQALLERGAADVKLCVLLDKQEKRETDIDADFVGFRCPDKFVIGYGLDYAHYFRELPYIGHLEEE
jgi:hypoxanthine phosphoribosyltransferase